MYIEIILYKPKKKVLKVNSSATNDNKEDFLCYFHEVNKISLYLRSDIFL